MDAVLKEIRKPVAGEMKFFETMFRDSMKTHVFLLDRVMRFVVKRKGKQMRPMLVFLSAGASGAICDSTYRGALLVELLHTATLLHDDVVDGARYRRGIFSVNALWKNKVAVLAGDFLLSRGLLLSIHHQEYDLLQILSSAVQAMSEGELLQIEKSKYLNMTEEVYYNIIQKKTASLIASCCGVGARSAGASQEMIDKMKHFGENIGMAFQLSDDLFDYEKKKTGKSLGMDVKERKITLPLIYALAQSSWVEKRKIIGMIKNGARYPKQLKKVIDYVKESGGIAYTKASMCRYHDEANQVLTTFPDSTYKSSLQRLVDFTSEREY